MNIGVELKTGHLLVATAVVCLLAFLIWGEDIVNLLLPAGTSLSLLNELRKGGSSKDTPTPAADPEPIDDADEADKVTDEVADEEANPTDEELKEDYEELAP